MRKNRVTTLPESMIIETRNKLANDGFEFTFEQVDQRLRDAIDKVRESMNSQGFDLPKDDYGAVRIMKLVMMGE